MLKNLKEFVGEDKNKKDKNKKNKNKNENKEVKEILEDDSFDDFLIQDENDENENQNNTENVKTSKVKIENEIVDESTLDDKETNKKEEIKLEKKETEIMPELFDEEKENTFNQIEENHSKSKTTSEFKPLTEKDEKFCVDSAFVDWFLHDIKCGTIKDKSLETRKQVAIFYLDRVSINEKSSEKTKVDKGGFLTEYKDYICNNILYLIQAVLQFDGDLNDISHSNWQEVNSSQYFKYLILIAAQGEKHISEKHADFKNAIDRLLKNIKDGNIVLDAKK